MNDKQLFFLVAGEPSGDMLGARLMAALRPLLDSISGEAMRRANYSVDRAENKLSFDEAARQLARD